MNDDVQVTERDHVTVRPSFVDTLAKMLSEKTGTRFEVVRRVRTYRVANYQPSEITRYFLRATRDGYSHEFGGSEGFTNPQMRYYLASLLDLVVMGFLRGLKP